MSDSSNGYHISFFRPTTPQALVNRNLTLWLVVIWFIAIFGFHFLLRAIEKPTPEQAYLSFENVWENIQSTNPETANLQEFGRATMSVLGKVMIAADDKTPLNNAVSWSVYALTEDSLRAGLIAKVKEFEKIKAEIDNISDPTYVAAKKEITAELAPVLGLDKSDVRGVILPLELSSAVMQNLTEETKANLPAVMSKYLIHNQSFLTDTKFLGFPFHYFYTAVFLLILFVVLCWLYCVRTDKINAKFNIVD
jgi:putative solute:sodium symporter small subunit